MHPDQGGSKKKVRSFSEDLFGFEGPAEDGSSPRAFWNHICLVEL
jgi:hypothetical protein